MRPTQVREEESTIFLTVLSESRIYRLIAETAEDTADWARAFELARSGRDKAVLKMGFLHRQVLGAWQAPRALWFVLDRGALFYFKNPPDFSPAAALKLDRSLRCIPRDGPPSATGEPDGYELDIESSAKLGKPTCWTLRADTAAGRNDWVHAIGAAIDALPMAAEYSTASTAEHRGWLLKQTRGIAGSGLLPKYQPRYVVLKGNALGYYDKPTEDAPPRGAMPLVENLLSAIVGDPELIFLDEPTTGLDPASRRELWEIIENFKADGKTVLITTHYMEEAERLCDRVAIFDSGKIIAEGTPQELIRSIGAEHVIEFSIEQENITLDRSLLQSLPTVEQVDLEQSKYHITASEPHIVLPALISCLAEQQISLASLSTRHASLEDVFVSLTGRHLIQRDD